MYKPNFFTQGLIDAIAFDHCVTHMSMQYQPDFIYLAALRLDKMTIIYKQAYTFNKMSICYINYGYSRALIESFVRYFYN